MCCRPTATIMLLLPLLIFFPSLLNLMFAMQNSALYRNPTGNLSLGNFKCDPFYYLWAEKLTSSMVKGRFFCAFLCVGEPRCYSWQSILTPMVFIFVSCWSLTSTELLESIS